MLCSLLFTADSGASHTAVSLTSTFITVSSIKSLKAWIILSPEDAWGFAGCVTQLALVQTH